MIPVRRFWHHACSSDLFARFFEIWPRRGRCHSRFAGYGVEALLHLPRTAVPPQACTLTKIANGLHARAQQHGWPTSCPRPGIMNVNSPEIVLLSRCLMPRFPPSDGAYFDCQRLWFLGLDRLSCWFTVYSQRERLCTSQVYHAHEYHHPEGKWQTKRIHLVISPNPWTHLHVPARQHVPLWRRSFRRRHGAGYPLRHFLQRRLGLHVRRRGFHPHFRSAVLMWKGVSLISRACRAPAPGPHQECNLTPPHKRGASYHLLAPFPKHPFLDGYVICTCMQGC